MAFIRKLLQYPGGRWRYIIWFVSLFLLPYTMFKIRRLDRHYSLDKLADFAFTTCFGLIEPAQVRYEILELLKILNEVKPKIILEIGTLEGGSLFLFTRIASRDAIIISVDLPPAPFLFKLRTPLYKTFTSKDQQLHLIRKDSHDKATLEKVKVILNNRKIDVLFVDGDHTYEGVKKDFEMYTPLVRQNGIVALHDILPQPSCEVNRFWDEIKSQYEHVEIIEDRKQNEAGIGLIKRLKNLKTIG